MMNIAQKRKQFERQYSRLFDDIYRFASYRIKGNKEAEDIVAETFLTAYERLNSYDPTIGSLRSWIFQIAKNKIIDYWRKYKITVDLEKIIHLFHPFESMSADFDQTLLLNRIYSNLNADMKILFTFRYIDGLSYEEIAQLTGRRADLLRKCFSRAHAKLRNKLQGLNENSI